LLTSYYSELNYVEASNISTFDLQVETATFNGLVSFSNDTAFNANVTVGGVLYGSIFGISDLLTMDPPDFAALSNVVIDNMMINDTMSINNMLEVGNNTTKDSVIVKVNGILEAVNVDFTSDQRIKHRIVALDDEVDVAAAMNGIKPVMFEYKHKLKNDPRVGFIAQNVEKHLSTAVNEIEDYKIPINRVCTVSRLIENVDESESIMYPDHRFQAGDKLIISLISMGIGMIECEVERIITPDIFTINFVTNTDKCKIEYIIYDTVKSIDYNQVLALLFSAVKTLTKRVQELEEAPSAK
jgi:hypothetical protein